MKNYTCSSRLFQAAQQVDDVWAMSIKDGHLSSHKNEKM
jgi:hypothetical protein